MRDLAVKMKSGFIFTIMAACAMFYNKINVFFLKNYGGDAAVGGYNVAWETVEGLSVLVSSALLGKVIFPLLARYWAQDRAAFRQLAGQTARSLWAASLPLIFLICVESDRFLPTIYGPGYEMAATAQRLLTPCLATAFLHNLAAYAMIGMRKHTLLHTEKDDDFNRVFSRVEKYENISDSMELEIANYLNQVSEGRLSSESKLQIRGMLREVTEIESIGDSCYNLARTISYYNIPNGACFEKGTPYNYWGLTKVGIGLVYRFGK